MTPQDSPLADFATLLRSRRRAAELTQETLAERAGLSVRCIRDIERRVLRTPRVDTLRLLATALGMIGAERLTFVALAERGEAQRAQRCLSGRDAAARRGNLPVPLAGFVGRHRQMSEITRLLATTRLLTLTGVGGVGKTRLALQVAAGLGEAFADGVFVVFLAALVDAALVASQVAQALGVREVEGCSLDESLCAFLRDKQLLLVLDNFEQVVEAAPLAATLVERCPHLRVLVTSRAVLRLSGEHTLPVPPLALPDPRQPVSAAQLVQYEAVRLFVDRAQAARADFAVTAATAPVVAEICRRLDGLPLALELAAARLRLLPLQALLERLSSRLALLTGGARDRPPRQQTLRNTIAWSYDLLHPGEQVLFRRLAVFVGGCTLAAAEAVCAGAVLPEGDVLDRAGALVEQSLLHEEHAMEDGTTGEPRFSLLETIRDYALEQLTARGEAEPLRQAHAAYFLALVEEAEPHLRGAEQALWLARLEGEHDNLRAALAWALEGGAARAAAAFRLGAAVWRFWYLHGHWSEGRRWLERILATDGGAPAAVGAEMARRARVLDGIGVLTEMLGNLQKGTLFFKESLTLARAAGDRWAIAQALRHLGLLAGYRGDYGQARALHHESLVLQREVDDRWGIAQALASLGDVARAQQDHGGAHALYEESLALRRELGHRWGIASSLEGLAHVAGAQQDYGQARALHEQSLAIRRELGSRYGIADSLYNLGTVALAQGDYGQATALYEGSLTLQRELGHRWGITFSLEGLARVAAAPAPGSRDPRRAVLLLGAAATLRAAMGARLSLSEQAGVEQTREEAQAVLGTDAFATAWAEGQAMAMDQAIAYALETS